MAHLSARRQRPTKNSWMPCGGQESSAPLKRGGFGELHRLEFQARILAEPQQIHNSETCSSSQATAQVACGTFR